MNDTHILQIIKNNIIFIVVFCVLLLLYIIFLCYQIYIDSKIIEKPYVTQCPDYWNIGPVANECIDTHNTYPKWVVPAGEGVWGPLTTALRCSGRNPPERCVSFNKMKFPTSDFTNKKCQWSKSNKISWDSIQSAC